MRQVGVMTMAVVSILSVAALLGCAREDAVFAKSVAASDELHLDELTPVFEGRLGPKDLFSTQPPTVVTVLGEDAAMEDVVSRATRAGYESSTTISWVRGSGSDYVVVEIRELDEGESIVTDDGKYVLQEPGVLIYVSATP